MSPPLMLPAPKLPPPKCGAEHPDSGARCELELTDEHGPRHVGWAHYPGQLVTWPTDSAGT